MLLLLVHACTSPPATPVHATATAPTDAPVADTADTATPEPAERFDVVVVGAGPAGVAAALTARELGASVLLLDREAEPGMGLVTGGRAFAVGTRWQAAQGLHDSVKAAQADWAQVTGADPEGEGVRAFLEQSAATLEWLVGYGLAIDGVQPDLDAGVTPRAHDLNWGAIGDARGLYGFFDGELRAGVEVTAPLLADGAVVGVRWTDVATGETGVTGAGAVVIATGGFLRNRAEVERALPEAVGRRLLYETNHHSDGGGLPFLDAVGAARLAPGQIGIYVHSIQDPVYPQGESLQARGVEVGILVGEDGERFVNEDLGRSFDLFDALPVEGDVYAVIAGSAVDALYFSRPAYNWTTAGVPEVVPLELVLNQSGDVTIGGSMEEVAAVAGIEATGLAATVDAWNATVAVDGIDAFGRATRFAQPLEGDQWAAVRLTPGLAKNFGGVSTDVRGHVLGLDGAPIPGLFAAGEVAGMVLGGGGGDGFTGSVNACYQGGRVAGAEAVAYAAGAR